MASAGRNGFNGSGDGGSGVRAEEGVAEVDGAGLVEIYS